MLKLRKVPNLDMNFFFGSYTIEESFVVVNCILGRLLFHGYIYVMNSASIRGRRILILKLGYFFAVRHFDHCTEAQWDEDH